MIINSSGKKRITKTKLNRSDEGLKMSFGRRRKMPQEEPIPGEDRKGVGEVRRIRIDKIRVVGRRRTIDPEKARVLAESMAKIGLQSPITVKPNFGPPVLVAGLHRLEAAKLLGWTHIAANFFEGSKSAARLWEISENLHRSDLTVLERSELLAEWVRLISEEEGEGAQRGRQPHDRGVSKSARNLGFTRDAIRRASAIAGISGDAKREAKEAKLDDKQSALLDIAKKPPEAQVERVREIANKRRNPDPDLATLKQEWADQGILRKRIWVGASLTARESFIKQVLRKDGKTPED
jgi:ParB family transcriptional regulator, chromosome partitioning protein